MRREGEEEVRREGEDSPMTCMRLGSTCSAVKVAPSLII